MSHGMPTSQGSSRSRPSLHLREDPYDKEEREAVFFGRGVVDNLPLCTNHSAPATVLRVGKSSTPSVPSVKRLVVDIWQLLLVCFDRHLRLSVRSEELSSLVAWPPDSPDGRAVGRAYFTNATAPSALAVRKALHKV